MHRPPELPVHVRALAIALLILGALGLMSAPFGVLGLVLAKGSPVGRMLQDPVVLGWVYGSTALGAALSAAQLVGAIGLLSRQRWGRAVLNAGSLVAVVTGVVGVVVNIAVVVPRMTALSSADPLVPPWFGPSNAVLGVVSGIVGGLVGLVVAVATLVILSRPEVSRALAARPVGASEPGLAPRPW